MGIRSPIWYNTSIAPGKKIFLLPLFLLLLFPAWSGAAHHAGESVERGTLSFLQIEGKDARVVPVLQTKEGQRIELRELGAVAPQLEQSGRREVVVRGRGSDNAFRVSDIKVSPARRGRAFSEKEGGLMLVNVSWSDASSSYTFRPSDYQYVKDWSMRASRGAWSWNPVTVLNLAIPRASSCANEEDFASEVRKELLAKDYPLYSEYRALAVVLPDAIFKKCGQNPSAAGYAYLGSWIDRYDPSSGLSVYNSKYTRGTWKRLLLHELGHTLGAGHAYTIACSNGSLNYEKIMESEEAYPNRVCVETEYGDPWDVMGSFNPRESALSPPTYAPGSSYEIGWIDDNVITDIPLDGGVHEVQLAPYDLPGSSQRVLRMRLPGKDSFLRGRSPGWLWIDYRDSIDLGEVFFSGEGYDWPSWPDGRPLAETLVLRFQPSPAMSWAFEMNSSIYNFPVSYPREVDPEYGRCEYFNPCEAWERRFGIRPDGEWKDPLGELGIYFREASPLGAEVVISTPFFQEPKRASIRFLETPRRITKKRSARFRFKVLHADRVTCKLDGRRPAPCADGIFQASGLRLGRHRLLVEAENKLGVTRGVRSWYIRKR